MSPHTESAHDVEAADLTSDLEPADPAQSGVDRAPTEHVTPQYEPVDEVVVSRRPLAAALLAAGATGLGMAYFARAAETGRVLDWALFAVLCAIAVINLRGLLDSRTDFLVADSQGFRYRLGAQWVGVQWEGVAQVVVEPRGSLVRDGRMLVIPHSLGGTLEGLDRRSHRIAVRNQKAYGAALALPLGVNTKTSVPVSELAEHFSQLAQDRGDVVRVLEEPANSEAGVLDAHTLVSRDWAPVVPAPRRQTEAGRSESLLSQDAEAFVFDDLAEVGQGEDQTSGRSWRIAINDWWRERAEARAAQRESDLAATEAVVANEVDNEPLPESDEPDLPRRSWAARAFSPAAGGSAPLTASLPTEGALARELDDYRTAAAASLPEERHLRRDGSVDLVFEPVSGAVVEPVAIGEAAAPVVIDDFATNPAFDPIIGPEISAARHRVRLSIDDLAERTRIRPHVLECIEVDDFGPCGGDIYARGHLRTLARILGQDGERWVEQFNQRYAGGPISARKVFEAELATGMTGSMRSTMGGPNWGVLGTAVLVLVMLWGLVRLVDGGGAEETVPPPALPMGAQWPSRVYDEPAQPAPGRSTAQVPLKIVAINAGTRVQVSGPAGNVLFTRALVLGETVTLRVPVPVTVVASQGGAAAVTVAGVDRGLLGEAGARAEEVYARSAE